MYPYDIDRIHMNTPGYHGTQGYVKNMYFLGYIKIHAGYSEIKFKSNPPKT